MNNTVDNRVALFDKSHIDQHPIFDSKGDEKNLFEAIRNDRLIVFYGAGVSRLAGCASWAELAANIVKRFPDNVFSHQDKEVLRDLAYRDPKKVISICYHRAIDEQRFHKDDSLIRTYYESIKDSVKPNNMGEFEKIHKSIFDLDAISYVTTNIDKGIESVKSPDLRRKGRFNLTSLFDLSIITDEVRNGNIFYLHGSVDAIDKTVFTVDSYYDFYAGSKSASVKSFLMKIFRGDYSVLFIGYSLEEQEILQNIFLANEEQRQQGEEYQHFILSPVYSKDLAQFNIQKMFFQIYSVKSIPYFIDYDGFGRLYHALNELKKQIRITRRPRISVLDKIDKVQDARH